MGAIPNVIYILWAWWAKVAHWLPADGLMQPSHKRPAMQWKSDIMSKSAYGQMNLLVWVQGKRKTCLASPPEMRKSVSDHWRHPGNVLYGHRLWKWWWGRRRQMEEQSVAAQSALLVIFATRLTPMVMGGTKKKPVCYLGLSTISSEQRKLIFTRRSESGTARSNPNCFRFESVQQLVSLFFFFCSCGWFFFCCCRGRFKLWCWRTGCCIPADLFLIRTEPSLGVGKVSHSLRDKQREEELHKVSPGWLWLLRRKKKKKKD